MLSIPKRTLKQWSCMSKSLMKLSHIITIFSSIILLITCKHDNCENCENTPGLTPSDLRIIWSSEKDPGSSNWFNSPMPVQYRLSEQDSLIAGTSTATFNVDPSKTYQTMQGMGSSLEEATVYNLSLMSQAQRTEAIKLLVDTAGMNLMRLTIGTSDFTGRPWYTYDDMPAGQSDTSLVNFSIQKDIDYGIIEIINEVQAINPNVKFFASPWSPPAWMKTSGSICGGTLKDGMYQVLAQYYRKFIQAYQTQGIPIYAMTLQNEPGISREDMPSMQLSYQQEINLVKALKTEFSANAITTKLWIYDHNFDNVSYPENVLADQDAYKSSDGTAFHDYAGDPSEMTVLHNLRPGQRNILYRAFLLGHRWYGPDCTVHQQLGLYIQCLGYNDQPE